MSLITHTVIFLHFLIILVFSIFSISFLSIFKSFLLLLLQVNCKFLCGEGLGWYVGVFDPISKFWNQLVWFSVRDKITWL